MTQQDQYSRIYRVVRRIPRGRVATYGQVAEWAGVAGHARQVGYALHALAEGSAVPWHRVLGASGTVSRRREFGAELVQRARLEAEGVRFDTRGRVALAVVGWRPSLRVARALGGTPGATAVLRHAQEWRRGS